MVATIAITGATGFVGRRTAELLVASGASVRALVRHPGKLTAGAREAMQVVEGDLFDEEALCGFLAGAEAVVHCAGELSDPARFQSVNVEGTARLATAAMRERIARFVHVSSLAAREPRLSAYGESKRAGEAALRSVVGTFGMIVRPPAVYGPRDRATLPLIAQLTHRRAFLPGTREQRFSLIHVDDLARALVTLAFAPPLSVGIHELDDGRRQGYAWADLARIAEGVLGRPVRVIHIPRPVMELAARGAEAWARFRDRPAAITRGKVAELYHPDWVCRNELLDRICEWKPSMEFADGFAMTVDWYRRRGWLAPASRQRQAPAAVKEGHGAE